MSLTKVTYSMIQGASANVLDFGADPTNTNDSTAAFQAALAASQSVYVPPGTYLISDNLVVNGGGVMFSDAQRFSTRIRVSATSGMTGAAISLSDSSSIRNIDIVSNTTADYDPNVLGIEGLPGAKWLRIENCFVQKFLFGIKVQSYYHSITDCQPHNCGYGIAIGDSGGAASGAVTIIGCHIRGNKLAGLLVYANTNANYGYNNTFEINNTHIICNGLFSHFGGYLGDPPVSVVTGSGDFYANLSNIDFMAAGAGDNGAQYGLNLITTDYGYALRVAKATIENATLLVLNQIRSDPVPGSVYRGSVLGQGRYLLNNVYFSTSPNSANYVLEESSTIDQQILSSGIKIPNYVNNGLFFDATLAADPLYIANTGGVRGSDKNPWGGSVLMMKTGGMTIRWTVPKNQVGKQHILMIYSGVRTAGSISGPGINTTGGTNITFDLSVTDLTKLGNNYAGGLFSINGGTDQSGRVTIALSACVVIPTDVTGTINFGFNADPATRFPIHGIVMTPRNPISATNDRGYPIGWFNTEAAALL